MSGELTLEVEWGNLPKLFEAMRQVGDQGGELDTYFTEQVCSKRGFDYPACVLSPISDALDVIAGYFTDARGFFNDRWAETIAAVEKSARDIDAQDGNISHDFSQYLGGVGAGGSFPAPPSVTVSVEAFGLTPVADSLEEPGEGEDTMPHNREWEAVTDTFDGLRDTINDAIDQLNGAGLSLPKLDERNLDDWLVYPLSGNYLAIQGNAEACGFMFNGMSTWGWNFEKISAKTVLALQGQTSAALAGHFMAYHLVMVAVGAVINQGSAVFDAIARVSERIAVAVENVLVTMAKTLLRVSTKLASKISAVGWLMLIWDVMRNGLDAITDIYDDIMTCKDIIQACWDLKDSIEAWAEEVATTLEEFQAVKDLMDKLPIINEVGLDGLPPFDETQFGQTLDDIGVGVEFDSEPEEGNDLEEELGDLEDTYPAEDVEPAEEEPEVDDDEMLMAPGLPPGHPDYQGSGSTGMTA